MPVSGISVPNTALELLSASTSTTMYPECTCTWNTAMVFNTTCPSCNSKVSSRQYLKLLPVPGISAPNTTPSSWCFSEPTSIRLSVSGSYLLPGTICNVFFSSVPSWRICKISFIVISVLQLERMYLNICTKYNAIVMLPLLLHHSVYIKLQISYRNPPRSQR